MTLSPEAQAQIAAGTAARRQRWNGHAPIVDPRLGRRPATIHTVDVGCEIWTDIDRRRTAHDQPLGGIILAITTDRHDNPDTGETDEHTVYRCYDPHVAWHAAFRTWPAHLLNPDSCEHANPTRIVTAIRRFATVIAQTRGPLTKRDVDLLVDATHLAQQLIGGNW